MSGLTELIGPKWDGTLVTGTFGDATRVLQTPPIFEPITYDPQVEDTALVPVARGGVEVGQPVGKGRSVSMRFRSEIVSSSAAACQRAIFTEFRAFNDLFDLNGAEKRLKFERKDTGGGDVFTEFIARCVSLPTFSGDNLEFDGEISGSGSTYRAVLWLPITFFLRFPWGINAPASAATLDFVDSGSGDTDTIANDGETPMGVRWSVQAVSGAVTKVRIQNTTTGKELTLKAVSGNLTTDMYVDSFYTDPTKFEVASGAAVEGTSSTAGDGQAWNQEGNNSWTITKTGGTSLTMRATYAPLFASI